MAFTFSQTNIRENQVVFIYEEGAFSGVRKIAGFVRDDIGKVFGAKPVGVEYENFRDTAAFFSLPVFFGTVGHSAILDRLSEQKAIDLFGIAGEREVYSVSVVDDLEYEGFSFESAIVIAGSDKRGTIYGLFRLSEMLGVSAFVNWLDVSPQRLSEFVLHKEDSFVSKTPSVKYRGFFINDEWPAFGNRCKHLYGGFNAKMYAGVFELLLRLKGNYLWPAMWTSVFYDDGPGEESAALADELGVIMGTSHHEPCMRQGEEYSRLRGPESEYGDAWDFVTNREGITRFWKDSLAARCRYENVVTVGMRGEADTPILSKGSTLSDNIGLLRDVIRTQNRIIEEEYGRDIGDIPRVFALYKEVEPYYYGDGKTEGLKGDPELDGVTLLLCDDNFGNLRHVPGPEERSHPGGYGMYYHFDYHGDPVSYEWFNTTYLPKVWEQMTSAYDNGITEMWIVNVGDIFTNEYPLAFFLDLAYDFDRWGTSDKNAALNYTDCFVKRNFASFTEKMCKETAQLLLGYTRMTYRRRTEAMNDGIYAPFAYCESDRMLDSIDDLIKRARRLYKSLSTDKFPFYEIVYMPLTATLNVQKMWILTGKNHAYAQMGSTYANTLADMIDRCIKNDRKLVKKLHTVNDGKWYGMGLSEHIGFKHWCEEECRYPIVHTFEPANKARLIVAVSSTGRYTEGGFWTGKELELPAVSYGKRFGGYIEISTASSGMIEYEISTDDEFLDIKDAGRSIECGKLRKVFISVDREKITGNAKDVTGLVKVSWAQQEVNVRVIVKTDTEPVTVIEAKDYTEKSTVGEGTFEVIGGFGRTTSSMKAFPQNMEFHTDAAPSVTYRFGIVRPGTYNIRLYTSPSNPPYADGKLLFYHRMNGGEKETCNMIPEGYFVAGGNGDWEKGVLENIRTIDFKAELIKGDNELTIGALSPGFVLERIVITPEGTEPPYSYLGPVTDYE